MLVSVKGEPIIRNPHYGKWEYVRETDGSGWRGYLCMGCDAVSEDGHCIMCGKPDPSIWPFIQAEIVANILTTDRNTMSKS